MSIVLAAVVVVVSAALAVVAMLWARRRAPEGSIFADGDRAAGVFGVLATGFSVLLGLIVFLAYSSYDSARAGAEDEARLVLQEYETAQFFPVAVRDRLGGELVCYARNVVNREWPRLERGDDVEGFNPWGARLFRTLRVTRPRTVPEQTAYDKWMDRNADREQARSDRIHASSGVIPASLWVVMFFTAATIIGFVLLFADSAEHPRAQVAMMGSVVAVIAATMLVIQSLSSPFHAGLGALEPVAMQRTLKVLEQRQLGAGGIARPPCRPDGGIGGAR